MWNARSNIIQCMDHKELNVWKQSVDFVVDIYRVSASFPKEEVFGLTSQMRRSAVSIPSNIAEGSARKNDAETIQFLHVALGSASELETQLIISNKLGFIEDVSNQLKTISEIKQQLLGLLRYLKNKNK